MYKLSYHFVLWLLLRSVPTCFYYQDYSKTTDVVMKFCGMVGHNPWTKLLDF